MKIARFRYRDQVGFGVVEGDEIVEAGGDMFGDFELTGQVYSMDEVRLLAPTQPSKIIALGLNYRDHAEEVGHPVPEEPLIFMKPGSAVIGPGDFIIYPSMSRRVDYECELGIVMGTQAKAVSREEAESYILGYTCFNDVTARDLQGKDGQWTRAKGFDTFAPMGPWISREVVPSNLHIETYLNGERRQSSTTANLIFGPFELVSHISHIMTLYPGDVIATGTPSGIGPMAIGDTVEVVLEGIGTLTNSVR
jgi:2-keto-4-pentenoate hydratase/2-oxohepta-3-ene-1,7-dioic acid hydratase in catechol pathway